MPELVYGWHFSNGTLNHQNQEIPVSAGLRLKVDGLPLTEHNGLSACTSAMDALQFFGVRPDDRLIVSRVRLEGSMIPGSRGSTLMAEQREHLWCADAEAAIEALAMSYVTLALDWLRTHNVVIAEHIENMLIVRQKWFEKEIIGKQLYKYARKLAAWAAAQPHPNDQALEWLDLGEEEMAMLSVLKRQYSPDDWQTHWRSFVDAEPVALARTLSTIMRHDTPFVVFETPQIAYHCQLILCHYDGWQRAMDAHSPAVTAYLNELMQGHPMSALTLDDIAPPAPYDENCQWHVPPPEIEFQRRLMSLAPAGYTEPDNLR